MNLTDTIVAVSSAPVSAGEGARSIVRVSGAGAWEAAGRVVSLPNGADVGWHGGLSIPMVHPSAALAGVLLFKGPRSFTGEDVAELHLPASMGIVRALLDEILHGRVGGGGQVRLAEAGEFSARAFFHGKIDLTQAEGISATISATNAVQLRAAAGLRQGTLYKEMVRLTEEVAGALALVEAGIDFSDEADVSFISMERSGRVIGELVGYVERLLATALRVDRVDGMATVVLVGKPNVGKSSLMNALLCRERAIVSGVAGTTRDMLSGVMRTGSGEVRLVDVPGEEEVVDEMRGKMMEARALALLEADLRVRVVDAEEDDGKTEEGPVLVVQNKVDLLVGGRERRPGRASVSAKTGEGIELLREQIGGLLREREVVAEGRVGMNQRHRALLIGAREGLHRAAAYTRDEAVFRRHPELLAAELREALDLLGQITGTVSPDEILGKIFSSFCIGK
jgi:tRNA modification GTPase